MMSNEDWFEEGEWNRVSESESESESFIWSLDLGAPTKTIAGRCREGHHKYRHNTIMLGDEYNR